MGYAVILVLVFYLVVGTLMWVSGFFIADTSEMREQTDVLMLMLSGVITLGIAIYARRELNRSKDKTSDKGQTSGRLIRALGIVGMVIISLGALARLYVWGSKTAASIPNKHNAAVPQKETWEEVKAKAERNLRGEK